MEILSPAGHWEAMVAAVQSGADAVYLGMGDYNARRGARNFSEEEFLAAVSYCHLRGVRVYLTLNTLLTDRELPGAVEALRTASRSGVDAIIIQDWGLLRLAKLVTPDLPLHASTQMSIHTLSGVETAARLGMRCAVLARELSREEIAHICENSPIAIEVFGHGALCMCYSGQCAMSAVIGQRSGNRGACAQPCRLPYAMDGGKTGHPLSLKDSSLARWIPQLMEMGVASLKLEGRMKRPEYVAVITEIYSRLKRENRPATAQEEQTLALAFSRSGFTDGYWQGKTGPAMFGTRPENTPDPKELFAQARERYEKEDKRLVPVTFTAAIQAGVPASLTAADRDGHTVTVTGDVPQAARSRALTGQEVESRLAKTGGTAFTCTHTDVQVGENLNLPASALNALRRAALEELAACRTAVPQRRELPLPTLTGDRGPKEPPALTVSLTCGDQLTEELMAYRPAVVSIPIHRMEEIDPKQWPETLFSLELPRIWRDADEPRLRRALREGLDRCFGAVQIHNIGHLPLLEDLPFLRRGDFGLNIFNTNAVEFLREENLSCATLSFELRHEQIRDLIKPIPCEAIVYGRLPLMVMENCIIANRYGCQAKNLHGPCTKPHLLQDRRGAAFPVCSVFGCRNEIENANTLYLADKPVYQTLGLTYARLRFTTESPRQCVQAMAAYCGEGDWQPEDMTRGLFFRGVE